MSDAVPARRSTDSAIPRNRNATHVATPNVGPLQETGLRRENLRVCCTAHQSVRPPDCSVPRRPCAVVVGGITDANHRAAEEK